MSDRSLGMVSEGTSHWLISDETTDLDDLVEAGIPQGVVERASCVGNPMGRDQDDES